MPEAELSCVVGIGAGLWDRLGAGARPAGLHPFRELTGPRHTAVATAGDLLFHIRAHRFDMCFELAQRLTEKLRGIAEVVDEVHGFRSFDERDVLGFVDGTENPEGAAAAASVLIGEEDPAFAGGSYVIVQKYLHDLRAWDALATEEQERIIGRTKLTDIELMLSHMFLGDPPGNTDRILDFSTAVTGSLFFVPAADLLETLAIAADDSDAVESDPGDGSLRIGSLRNQPG